MEHQVGEILIGTVNEVKPYALFFIFDDGSKGLLHISEISDTYIRDIEKYGTKGDKIKVQILSIDESNGFLRISYKRIPIEERYSTHDDKLRSTPSIEENDFKPLKEKLNEWIDTTLERKNSLK